jgi:hypothetical protein
MSAAVSPQALYDAILKSFHSAVEDAEAALTATLADIKGQSKVAKAARHIAHETHSAAYDAAVEARDAMLMEAFGTADAADIALTLSSGHLPVEPAKAAIAVEPAKDGIIVTMTPQMMFDAFVDASNQIANEINANFEADMAAIKGQSKKAKAQRDALSDKLSADLEAFRLNREQFMIDNFGTNDEALILDLLAAQTLETTAEFEAFNAQLADVFGSAAVAVADPSEAVETADAALAGIGHNEGPDLSAMPDLEEIAEEIKSLVVAAEAAPGETRKRWLRVSELLVKARDASSTTAQFGKWVKACGIGLLPGLETNSARSDAIWVAEHLDRAATVPETAISPRTIRHVWRRDFMARCKNEAEALVSLEATDPPDVEEAAAQIAKKTHGDAGEAYEAIQKMIEAEVSGSAEVEARAKTIKSLQKALENACNAGLPPVELCEMAQHVWGGHFTFTTQPSLLHEAVSNLIAGGYSGAQIMDQVSTVRHQINGA